MSIDPDRIAMDPVELYRHALNDSDLAPYSTASTVPSAQLWKEFISSTLVASTRCPAQGGGELLHVHSSATGEDDDSAILWLIAPPGTRLPGVFDSETRLEWRLQHADSRRMAPVKSTVIMSAKTAKDISDWAKRIEIDRELTSLELAFDIAKDSTNDSEIDWLAYVSEPVDLRRLSKRVDGLGNPSDLMRRVMALLSRWPDGIPEKYRIWRTDLGAYETWTCRADNFAFIRSR